MKKLFFTLILAIFLILTSLIIILSTVGIETDKFNSLISKKINQSNNNINLKLNVIKFKLDIKEISLFLETLKPQIYYRNTIVPAKNIKVYVDFISIIKLKPKIRKINLDLEDLDINEIKKLSSIIKPSNFKSLINNKIRKGKLISELEIYFNENNLLENFIARGSVSNFKAEVTDELNLDKTNFSFFADKTDVLIKNIVGELDVIKISDGGIKLKLHPEISMESNFKTNIKYNNKSFNNYTTLIKDFKYAKDIISFEADLNNNLLISLDKTYKIKKYNYRNNGEISKANFNFKKPKKNYFSEEEINQLFLLDSKIKTNFSEGTNNANISGKYSINNGNFLKFDMVNIVKKEALNLKIDYHYGFTSPMILFLNDNNVKMDIKAGSFCFKSFNFDFSKEMINNKAYQIYAGKLHSYTPSTTLSTFSNHNLASDLACHYDEVELRILDNKDYDVVNVILNNDTVFNYSHIGGYITSYNRINTFRELFKLDYDDILGFKCDGFICKNGNIDISESSMWDTKEIVKNFSWGDVLYYELEDDNSDDLLDYGNKPKNNLDDSLLGIDNLYTKQYIALSGAGGSGKTTTTAKKYPEMLFIANNWRLITQKIDEHKIEGNTIHKLIGHNCDKYSGCPSVIFYDEINTYSAVMIKKAIKLYPYSQHILCGDFEKVNDDIIYYQCSNTMNKLFTSFKHFDIHHFDKNYRTNDKELLKKLNGLRAIMKSSKMDINKIKEFVLTHFKNDIINEDYLIKNYDYKTDTVLCSVTNGANSQTSYYSKLLNGKKYLCINHNKNHLQKKLNGDKNVLLKGDILIKPDGEILKRFEQRDAFTIHSVQGLTLKTGTLYIIFNRIFCPAQLYTALSRVTHLNQIKILA